MCLSVKIVYGPGRWHSNPFDAEEPMTYDATMLAREILHLLQSRPRLTLTELSRQLGIDRHTIEKACIEATRKSFREHKRALRYVEVCRLLSQGHTTSVKEVAFLAGFSSPAALSRFVRSVADVTPIELRKRLRAHIS
jgi:AraC-like DNA-binding protein